MDIFYNQRTWFVSLFFLVVTYASGQQTVGLIQHDSASLDNGYVLFAPMGSDVTYLIDKCGRKIHSWASAYKPGLSCYLLPDGTLLRTGILDNFNFIGGGRGGIVEKIDWNGNVIWSYKISDSLNCQHHDVRALKNGNVLVIAWEAKSKPEAIAQGRRPMLTPNSLWSEQILEIEPVGATGGKVVWEWHLWDHLVQDFDVSKPNYGVVNKNPQLMNLNYNAKAGLSDWIHLNAVDYNDSLDQILLSPHAIDEVWIIDHSTTTAQAAGHVGGKSGKGGDFLYRWGNPLAYDTGRTTRLFGQHNAYWIPKGMPYENQIMIFNNGNGRTGGNYSTIEIINPPLAGYNYIPILPYGPDTTSWIYNAGNTNNFYAALTSGAQQLPNGNVIFTNGPAGTFSEIDSLGKKVWHYVNPTNGTGFTPQGAPPSKNSAFRCIFYPMNYSGFNGHTLTAGNIIEDTNTVSSMCNLTKPVGIESNAKQTSFSIYPNPVSDFASIAFSGLKSSVVGFEIYDVYGKQLLKNTLNLSDGNTQLDLSKLSNGCYWLTVFSGNESSSMKIMVLK